MTGREVMRLLLCGKLLSRAEILALLADETLAEPLRAAAREKTDAVFGRSIYLRGLIEISSVCKNDCYYCGLRRSNHKAERYRLSEAQILSAAENGYAAGLRTFVLQGGEDGFFTAERVGFLVRKLKERFSDAAVTLSLGEQEREVYAFWRECGADRYLLRHETADKAHYEMLHPAEMSWERRRECLYALKELGYQTGAGFMVGAPYQTTEMLAEDLLFLQSFRPHMIGIGPFLPQRETPFAEFPAGSPRLTMRLISILRLMHPRALLPATTALATLLPNGREIAIMAGANVVMPNLSPEAVRGKYAIYDNKAAEPLAEVRRKIEEIGFEIHDGRGDYEYEV